MFIWLQLPPAVDAAALLPQAVQAGMAFVPGSAFYADTPAHHTLRLSFVTADRPAIDQAIQILAQLLKAQA
jgi:2-aminoadipate transaminase